MTSKQAQPFRMLPAKRKKERKKRKEKKVQRHSVLSGLQHLHEESRFTLQLQIAIWLKKSRIYSCIS
jgi:hypothetical protein